MLVIRVTYFPLVAPGATELSISLEKIVSTEALAVVPGATGYAANALVKTLLASSVAFQTELESLK